MSGWVGRAIKIAARQGEARLRGLWDRSCTGWFQRLGLFGLALFMALAMPVNFVHAQGATPPAPVTDDAINQVAKQLFCPVCENTPLDVCPTEACAQWRALIGEKLNEGWTTQQILDYFAAQYGERVLAKPSTRGLNILVWVVPPLLLLAGGFGLWRFLRGQVQPATQRAAAATPPAPADEYAKRLEQELQQRR